MGTTNVVDKSGVGLYKFTGMSIIKKVTCYLLNHSKAEAVVKSQQSLRYTDVIVEIALGTH